MKQINAEQAIQQMKQNNAVLVDVRTVAERQQQPIAGVTVSADWFNWRQEASSVLNAVGKDQPVIMMCRSGRRSQMAGKWLLSQGYKNVYNLVGGAIAMASTQKTLI